MIRQNNEKLIYPLVSIVMPVYNADRYIVQAIESVLSQSYKVWELIIVDDCSSDKTVEIISDYSQNNSNIRVFKRNTNSGGCRVPRFEGVLQTAGEYICSIDADDFIEQDFLLKLIERQHETRADIVLDRMVGCDENGREIGSAIPRYDFNMSQILTGREAVKMTLSGWRIAMAGMLVKRDIYYSRATEAIKNPINSSFAIEFDQRMIIFGAQKIAMVNASYYYRNQPNSVTSRSTVFSDLMVVVELCYQFIETNYSDDNDAVTLMQCEYIDTTFLANRSYMTNYFSFSKKDRVELRSKIKVAHRNMMQRKMRGKRRIQSMLTRNFFLFDILSFVAIMRFKLKR